MRGLLLALAGVWGCAQAGAQAPHTGDDDDQQQPDGGGSDTTHTCPMSCDDTDVCTTDVCDNGTCTHMPVSCDDADACTTDTCDMVTGCAHTNNNHGMQVFAANGTIQMFTVPACVASVHIVAAGAQGGGAVGVVGGMGATMDGDFAVAVGQAITVLPGGQGVDGAAGTNYGQRGGTGGGGTFVVRDTTILVIAGGGGGACGPTSGTGTTIGVNGGPGQVTTNGQSGAGSTTGGAGGTNGGGGVTYPNPLGYQGGTGGGGYSGDGINNSTGATMYGTANTPGLSFVDGAAGGIGGSMSGRNGGFGGGGSAGFTGGGGGGYSGGGAGSYAGTTYSGGGGGSINNGTNQNNVTGNHAGPGAVTITW